MILEAQIAHRRIALHVDGAVVDLLLAHVDAVRDVAPVCADLATHLGDVADPGGSRGQNRIPLGAEPQNLVLVRAEAEVGGPLEVTHKIPGGDLGLEALVPHLADVRQDRGEARGRWHVHVEEQVLGVAHVVVERTVHAIAEDAEVDPHVDLFRRLPGEVLIAHRVLRGAGHQLRCPGRRDCSRRGRWSRSSGC